MQDKPIRVLVAVSSEKISENVKVCLNEHGITDIHTAFTMYQAVAMMHDHQFNMFVIDDLLLVSGNPEKVHVAGIDFVRFVRMCEGPVSEAHILFLTQANHPEGILAAQAEFSEAYASGASSVMALPISTAKYERHVAPALENPQPFVRDEKYTGPCRRRVEQPVKNDRRKST